MRWWSKASLGKWESADVAGHEVRYWEPAKRASPYALLYLHDENGKSLEEVPFATRLIETLNWPIICPQAGASWWLDQIVMDFDAKVTPMEWLMSQVVPWAVQQHKIAPRGLALLGVGMGGQGVLNLGFSQGDRFPLVVSLQACIAFEQLFGKGSCIDQCFTSPEHARQYTAGMMVNPRKAAKSLAIIANPLDTLWYRGNDRLHEKLVALGIEHHFGGLSPTGSVLPPEDDLPTDAWWQEQMDFVTRYIQAAMQAESRRLL